MNESGYLFLGLTAIVAALSAILTYALVQFVRAARGLARKTRTHDGEAAFVTTAMEDALRSLRLQERAMRARAEASERLSDEIVASLTSGLLVVDDTGVIRMLNPAGRRLLGIRDESWRRPFRDVLSAIPELPRLIDECLARSRPVVRRTIRTQAAAGPTHLGVTVSPIRDEAGRAYGAICLFSDLSDIMELEEQLRLKDSLARLGELTAGIAHEFRNGLATIHGYSRLLDLDRLPDDFRPYVNGIRSETETLGQVVTNFLNFARPTQPVLSLIDMGGVVARVVDDLGPEVRKHGGELLVSGDFAHVEGDDVLLRQAMSNLCRNALEACVDAGITPRIVVQGAVERDQRLLRVTVIDNGPGLAPEVAEGMFRPFFTTKARGTGLGLALVQKIIVTHNGRISALPQAGGGARLAFALPLVQTGEPTEPVRGLTDSNPSL